MASPIFKRFWRLLLQQQKQQQLTEQQAKQRVVGQALGAMGPAGRVIGQLLRESPKRKQYVERLYEEIKQQGELVEESERKPKPTPDPGWKQRQQQPQQRQQPRGIVTVNVNGQRRHYRETDPIVTGKMVSVNSSNVHSIGFKWNSGDPANSSILVRFLESGRGGAMYAYHNIHPDMFMEFQRANSKGGFVWDHFRIRGTVSGHQVPYTLEGISGSGYVPRQAVRVGNEEMFIGRTVVGRSQRTGARRVYQSELPNQRVRRLPNRAEPNRARPNRGN